MLSTEYNNVLGNEEKLHCNYKKVHKITHTSKSK